MIDNLYKDLITVTEVSPSLLDPVAITLVLSPDRQPSENGVHLDLGCQGTGAGGVIRIVGEQAGSPVTENVTIAAGEYCPPTVNTFDTVTRLELSGISGGTVWMDQVRGQGEPILRELVIKTLWGSVVAKSGNVRAMGAGEVEQSKYVMAALDDAALKILPTRFFYVQQGEQTPKKYRLTFLTPPGRKGNVNGDLLLIESDAAIPT